MRFVNDRINVGNRVDAGRSGYRAGLRGDCAVDQQADGSIGKDRWGYRELSADFASILRWVGLVFRINLVAHFVRNVGDSIRYCSGTGDDRYPSHDTYICRFVVFGDNERGIFHADPVIPIERS